MNFSSITSDQFTRPAKYQSAGLCANVPGYTPTQLEPQIRGISRVTKREVAKFVGVV